MRAPKRPPHKAWDEHMRPTSNSISTGTMWGIGLLLVAGIVVFAIAEQQEWSQNAGSLLFLALGYVLPVLIAIGRRHHQTAAIVALNVLLGWTALGWIAALVWSLTAVRRDRDG